MDIIAQFNNYWKSSELSAKAKRSRLELIRCKELYTQLMNKSQVLNKDLVKATSKLDHAEVGVKQYIEKARTLHQRGTRTALKGDPVFIRQVNAISSLTHDVGIKKFTLDRNEKLAQSMNMRITKLDYTLTTIETVQTYTEFNRSVNGRIGEAEELERELDTIMNSVATTYEMDQSRFSDQHAGTSNQTNDLIQELLGGLPEDDEPCEAETWRHIHTAISDHRSHQRNNEQPYDTLSIHTEDHDVLRQFNEIHVPSSLPLPRSSTRQSFRDESDRESVAESTLSTNVFGDRIANLHPPKADLIRDRPKRVEVEVEAIAVGSGPSIQCRPPVASSPSIESNPFCDTFVKPPSTTYMSSGSTADPRTQDLFTSHLVPEDIAREGASVLQQLQFACQDAVKQCMLQAALQRRDSDTGNPTALPTLAKAIELLTRSTRLRLPGTAPTTAAVAIQPVVVDRQLQTDILHETEVAPSPSSSPSGVENLIDLMD